MIFLHKKAFWRMSISTALAATLLAGCGGSSSGDDDGSSAPDPSVRSTEQGQVKGLEKTYGFSFKGIPYAAAPTGERRFAGPEPRPGWGDVLDASEFGNDCPQSDTAIASGSVEEDCLNLNVYVPYGADGSQPVMVWIHGGAFNSGSGGSAYNPARLVAKDVVVVTVNYRLGAFGFLAHPELSDEQGGASGNYGLLDQVAALEWVQANISEFGGDDSNVTIFGESAGGHAVLSLLAADQALTAGLFHKVIVQSGSYAPEQMSLSDASMLGQGFASVLGCDDDILACLRRQGVQDILEAQSAINAGNGPVPNYSINSPILKESIASSLENGSFSKVPVMIGTNRDEYTLFEFLSTTVADLDEGASDAEVYEASVADFTGNDLDDSQGQAIVDAIVDAYPLGDQRFDGNIRQAMSAIGTDVVFSCNSLTQAKQLASKVATYVYEFTDEEAPLAILPNKPDDFELRASHAFEIQYVLNDMPLRTEKPDQIALSDAMLDYWTEFARFSLPSSAKVTDDWPEFAPESGQMMELKPSEPSLLPASDFRALHRCAIWNS